MTITFYKLHHATDNTKECYIGSTGDFKARKNDHKANCNNPNCRGYIRKVYTYIREHDGYNEWMYSVLEERSEPMSTLDRFKRERELTAQHNACLNQQKAGAAQHHEQDHKGLLQKIATLQLSQHLIKRTKDLARTPIRVGVMCHR